MTSKESKGKKRKPEERNAKARKGEKITGNQMPEKEGITEENERKSEECKGMIRTEKERRPEEIERTHLAMSPPFPEWRRNIHIRNIPIYWNAQFNVGLLGFRGICSEPKCLPLKLRIQKLCLLQTIDAELSICPSRGISLRAMGHCFRCYKRILAGWVAFADVVARRYESSVSHWGWAHIYVD